MGLITGLLTLPIAPVRGVVWLTEKIAEEAERELYDEGRIVRELADLDAAREAGEINEEQYDLHVEELLARLEIGRQLELAKGAYGG